MMNELSNTSKRILAAVLLILLLSSVVYLGKVAFSIFVIIVGFLLVDECVVNLFKSSRYSMAYILNVIIYGNLLGVWYFFYNINQVQVMVTTLTLILGFLFVYYLFVFPQNYLKILNIIKKISIFWGTYFALCILLFLIMLKIAQDQWIQYLLLLLIICFGMDTGGWFFGKNFGKRKLWPSVSPNKTVEGLVGGVFLSGVLATTFYICFFESYSLIKIMFFPVLGGLSHIGDLFQSKLKRQCGIKNSSSLIPGHGGVYDRLDSVLFLVPYYVILMFYKQIF